MDCQVRPRCGNHYEPLLTPPYGWVQEALVWLLLAFQPAFTIYAIFFGKPFLHQPPRERYAVWNYSILKAGEEGPPLALSLGTSIESTTTINGHPLYVPDDPQHNGVLARLTITYHNTPGRQYASIYDYHRFLGWRRVSDVENIEYDLNELDAMHPMTQQANEFFWRLGQSRP